MEAKVLLHKLSITSPPIRPREIVKRLELLLKETDAGDRFDGWILQANGTAAICINSAISSEARKNFTIAHELGHFRLSWHSRQPQCLKKDIGIISAIKTEEAEANEFAAELLMPEDMVRPLINSEEIGLGAIQKIADTFETSFTSSAFRYIQLTGYPAALVICEGRKVKQVSLSNTLREMRYKPIERETDLSAHSLAIDFFSDSGVVVKTQADRCTILPSVWFPEVSNDDFTCMEEVRGLPAINKTVSLVWVEENQTSASSYDEDEDDLL